MTIDRALSIMTDGRGTHFDPTLLDVFFGSIDEVLAIRDGKQYNADPARSNTPRTRRRRRSGVAAASSTAVPAAKADKSGGARQSLVG